MPLSRERENIVAKMVAAAMREKFSQLTRKYGQEATFQVWVEYMTKRDKSIQLLEGRWHPDLSLAQALDILDEYSRSIERAIQERLEEERKRQE